MASETILISEVIPATPARIFSAWLDSREHSAFTGSKASVEPQVGGAHTAWDGYVQGRTLEMNDGQRIVQSWRTSEFPADSPDSRVEITLEATIDGTLLTLLHTDIPSGQSDRYRDGWNEHYLSRLKTYFADSREVDVGDLAFAAIETPSELPSEIFFAEDVTEVDALATAMDEGARPRAPRLVEEGTKAAPRKATAQKEGTPKATKVQAKTPKAKTTVKATKKPTARMSAKRPVKKKPEKRRTRATVKRTALKGRGGTKAKPAPKRASSRVSSKLASNKKAAKKPTGKSTKKPTKKPASKVSPRKRPRR